MSQSVGIAQVHNFRDEIFLLSAQRGSKLRPFVRVRTNVVGKTDHWERLGTTALQTSTTRHGVWNDLNPAHSRRRVTFSDKDGRIFVDKQDLVKMLINPQNEYALRLADAAGYVWDDLIIAAVTGNATSVDEVDATANVALGAAQQIAAGGTGLTFTKVNQAIRILNQNDVDQSGRIFVVSPQAVEDLLAETEVTSSDFSDLQALKTAGIRKEWMGCQWVMSTRLTVVSLTRTCFVYQRNAIGLSIGIDQNVEIDKNVEHRNSIQVAMQVSAGATRIEEASVVQVDITEV